MKQEKNKIHKKRLALGGFSWHKRQGLLNSKQKILSKAFACEKIIKCLNPFMCQESAKITIFVIVQDTKVVKYYVAFEKKNISSRSITREGKFVIQYAVFLSGLTVHHT